MTSSVRTFFHLMWFDLRRRNDSNRGNLKTLLSVKPKSEFALGFRFVCLSFSIEGLNEGIDKWNWAFAWKTSKMFRGAEVFMEFILQTFTSTMALAILGGFFSFASTAFGSFIAPRLVARGEGIRSTRRWLDFAMGVMLSSVAFSLLGPELLHAVGTGFKMWMVILGAALGIGFVWCLQIVLQHPLVQARTQQMHGQESSTVSNSKILLALVLILHNFPEGMGAGASMAGMNLADAIPVQAGLAIQNVVEGAILTLCFVGFGWSWSRAIFGGVLSGVVEWGGAAVAGIGLQYSHTLLSPLLAAAGGAMLMSVVLEIREHKSADEAFRPKPFLIGLVLIPIMNMFLN